jgi:subtilisin family serine protease
MGHGWDIAAAVLRAVDPDRNPATDDGAQVINLSLGSLTRTRIIGTIASIASCQPAVPGDPVGDRSDPGYLDDDQRCVATGQRGTVVIAAAGNDGSKSVKQYPAAEGVYGLLALAATTEAYRLAPFSNSGSWIGLAAPGDGITSTVPGGYATWGGTSMAAPFASGTAALLRQREPALPARDVTRRMERAAGTLCGSAIPRLDALAALTDTTAPSPCP